MKKTTILSALIFCALLIASAVQATVWRVNNTAGSSAHYTSIQAAHDAATTVNGDTLYVEASSASVGALSPASVLPSLEQDIFWEKPADAGLPSGKLCRLHLLSGWQRGQQGDGTLDWLHLPLYFRHFHQRCYIYTSSYPIYAVSNGVSNIIISQNYLYSYYYWNPAVYFPYSASNILVSNNFIYGSISTIAKFFRYHHQ